MKVRSLSPVLIPPLRPVLVNHARHGMIKIKPKEIKRTLLPRYCGDFIEKDSRAGIILFMETMKMDDPRLDESFGFLFAFRKGDVIVKKGDPSFRGEIIDGVYIGEFPGPTAGAINSRGKTLYEIKLADSAAQILAEEDIEKAGQ